MITASAPGSLMLFGEHAVLRGKHAIVMALDKRLRLSLSPLPEKEIVIQSTLGNYRTTLETLQVEKPFHYILQVLKMYPPSSGLRIHIDSEMSPTMGFGTSASVVIAMLGGLMSGQGPLDKQVLFERALRVIRTLQGCGSGADLAASLWGGVGLYRSDPFLYQKLKDPPPLYALYMGYKTPTAEVVRLVKDRFQKAPHLLAALDHAYDTLTQKVARYGDNPILWGRSLNDGSALMEAYGVYTKDISSLLWKERERSYGIKLSGSGLGDCAIGCVKEGFYPKDAMPLRVALKGLLINEKSEETT